MADGYHRGPPTESIHGDVNDTIYDAMWYNRSLLADGNIIMALITFFEIEHEYEGSIEVNDRCIVHVVIA